MTKLRFRALEAPAPERQNRQVVPWLRTSSLFPPIDAALDNPNGLLAPLALLRAPAQEEKELLRRRVLS